MESAFFLCRTAYPGAYAQDPPPITRFLIQTGTQALGLWDEPRTWAHGYIRACRRVGMATEAIRSRSRSFPASFYAALDDILFDERVERAVKRALERARRRWWQGLSCKSGGKASDISGKHLFIDTMTTPRSLPFTLPCNPANFCTENPVGQFGGTETMGMGFFGYVSRLYASLK
jgi:hypothetical protein